MPKVDVPDRAKEIIRYAAAADAAGKAFLANAIKAGELLKLQKKELDHGKWLPWIAANLPFSRAKAARLILLYDNRELLKCNGVLHYVAACELLKKPRPERHPEVPADPLPKDNKTRPDVSFSPVQLAEFNGHVDYLSTKVYHNPSPDETVLIALREARRHADEYSLEAPHAV